MIWNHSKLKNRPRILFYRYFANQRNMSLLLKRDYSSNKYRWKFLGSILRSIISFYIYVEISSTLPALTFQWAFSRRALYFRGFLKSCRFLLSASFIKTNLSWWHVPGGEKERELKGGKAVGVCAVAVSMLAKCCESFMKVRDEDQLQQRPLD